MAVDQMSILSYREICANGYISRNQQLVAELFEEYGQLTGEEASSLFEQRHGKKRTKSETVRNRITELEQYGILEKLLNKVIGKTGKRVNVWRWTGKCNPVVGKKLKKLTKAQIIANLERKLEQVEDELAIAKEDLAFALGQGEQ